MAATYQLKVITPQGIAYTGEVEHLMIPAENGFVGVLAHHAPYITSSSGGELKVRNKEGKEESFTVGTGFFEVAENQASFLTQSFESND